MVKKKLSLAGLKEMLAQLGRIVFLPTLLPNVGIFLTILLSSVHNFSLYNLGKRRQKLANANLITPRRSLYLVLLQQLSEICP